MRSGEVLLSGGPYYILQYPFTFTKETCVPTTNACAVLLFANGTTPATYAMNLNGEEGLSNVGRREQPQTSITTIEAYKDP